MDGVVYRVNLYLNGQLIGDIRKLAEGLNWTRRRTMSGVDSITFSVNDRLMSEWCAKRNTTLAELLKPIALECRIVRNGEEVIGGFMYTMPSLSPNNASANLSFQFDGYLNLLEGVYLHPTAPQTARMGQLVMNWISIANQRSDTAGKGYNFVTGHIDTMNSVTQTIDGYKTVKQAIVDRCDNVSGAGKFDLYFYADKTYDVIKDENFGREVSYQINYPMSLNGVSATTITAEGSERFSSHVIAIGSGEVSYDVTKNTAITTEQTNSLAVQEYGYYESMIQNSSVSRMDTLVVKCDSELARVSEYIFDPQITLIGRQVAPSSEGDRSIWIGDRVKINNTADYTGLTSGMFRVMELSVDVSGTNAETITPTLERYTDE